MATRQSILVTVAVMLALAVLFSSTVSARYFGNGKQTLCVLWVGNLSHPVLWIFKLWFETYVQLFIFPVPSEAQKKTLYAVIFHLQKPKLYQLYSFFVSLKGSSRVYAVKFKITKHQILACQNLCVQGMIYESQRHLQNFVILDQIQNWLLKLRNIYSSSK